MGRHGDRRRSGYTARPIGINRILGGNPPTAMQFNTGTQMNDLAQQGLLRPLDDLAAKEQDWKSVLTPAFFMPSSFRVTSTARRSTTTARTGSSIPRPVFAKAGVTEEPKTWDEMFAALDKIKAAGLIPVAVGGQPWQLQSMFNAILLGEGGKRSLPQGLEGSRHRCRQVDKFKHVAEIFAKLRDYQDEGSPNRDWNVATGMLIDGKAGIQFMGDWAKGEFIHADMVADKDFGCILGPGESNFMMGGDIFVFPVLKDKTADRRADAAGHRDHVQGRPARLQLQERFGSGPARRRHVEARRLRAEGPEGAQGSEPSDPGAPTC